MTRLLLTFLAFLTLATLSAGTAYQIAQNLFSGREDVWGAPVLAISALLFGFAILVLWRMVYLTVPRRR
ncbi:MAG: hypothetical protein HY327_13055 [Chloroflexi bacterium]|nr:hypothetical protein [Chloroflexota bacterium]